MSDERRSGYPAIEWRDVTRLRIVDRLAKRHTRNGQVQYLSHR